MVNQSMDAVREPARTAATRGSAWRSWRGAAGLSGLAAGAVMITGAFLPWVTTFAGLIGIAGFLATRFSASCCSSSRPACGR
jgi:hypothetical protein